MKRFIALAVTIGLLSVLMAQAAVAVPGETTTCQQGGDNDRVGAWEEWSEDDVEAFLREGAEDMPWITEEMILARTAEIMGFNDHNDDGYLCVMAHYLPNDASGADKWLNLQDNHYDPPQS